MSINLNRKMKSINLNKKSMLRATDTAPVLKAIDDALLAGAAAEKRRKYIGASAIGGECARQVQFDYMGVPPDETWQENPRFIRIRQRGHLIEDMAIKWFTDAGFKFRLLESGEQLRFVDADGEFSGGVDGVIEDGPIDVAYPFLWEHKGIGRKSWRYIESRGVVKAKPVYAGQVATYQGHLELGNPALFQATDVDSMELHFEWIPYNPALAQELTDRAVDIIKDTRAGMMRPRAGKDKTAFVCRFCKYKDTCFAMEK